MHAGRPAQDIDGADPAGIDTAGIGNEPDALALQPGKATFLQDIDAEPDYRLGMQFRDQSPEQHPEDEQPKTHREGTLPQNRAGFQCFSHPMANDARIK
jgi:hypothetical protein